MASRTTIELSTSMPAARARPARETTSSERAAEMEAGEGGEQRGGHRHRQGQRRPPAAEEEAQHRGAEVREHTALYPVLLQTIEGTLAVTIGDQLFQLTPGDLLHIEPHVPHSVTAADQAKLQLTVLMIDSPGPSKVPLSGI